LWVYPTLVMVGTELAALYQAGSYHPQTLDQAVSLCQRMLLLARRAGIPVLRLGLQPTAELGSPGVLLAGPYHPAFGQLVESELYFDLMCSLALGVPEGSSVEFLAPLGRTSDLVGQGRRNLARIAERFGIRVHKVRESAGLDAGRITLQWDGGERSGSWG
jgi:hypothetical protein